MDSGFISSALARLVHGFVLDCRMRGQRHDIIVVELDSGTGRFGVQVLTKYLTHRMDLLDTDARWFNFVMTNASDDVLVTWEHHPMLRSLVQRGWLDFALIADGRDGRLSPLRHRRTLLHDRRSNTRLLVIKRVRASDDDSEATNPSTFFTESMRALEALPADAWLLVVDSAWQDNLSSYAQARGAGLLSSPYPTAQRTIFALLFGDSGTGWHETVQAYQDTIMRFGPDDWSALQPVFHAGIDDADVRQLRAYIRLSGWDHRVFATCLPRLLLRIQRGALSPGDRERLYALVHEVCGNYLALGEEQDDEHDIVFVSGMLLFGLEYYQASMAFFKRVIRYRGESVAANYNLALCAFQLELRELALEYIDAALALAPGFATARRMRLRVMSGM